MSSQSIEKEYDDFNEWLDFGVKQILKNLYTCLPAKIQSYDASTKRAQVKVSLSLVKTDGTTLDYPAIADVPVIFPSSSDFILQFPLKAGDNVLVLFSQRGLNAYKDAFDNTTPDKYGFFSLKDAVAIPGFGSIASTPADTDAMTLQTADGTTSIAVKDGEVTITAAAVNISAPGGTVTVNADTFTVNANLEAQQDISIQGAVLPPDHRHGDVQSGGSDTSTPIP